MKELIELRKAKKAKKPAFVHQDSWKRKRLPQKKWRKPKGLHSKMRLKFKGNLKLPSRGYRSPAKVRALDGSGVETVLIRSLKQMENLTSEAIIIASALGAKKRLEIIKKAGEKKLAIVNLDPEAYAEKVKKNLEERSKKKRDAAEKAEKNLKKEENKKAEESKKPESAEKKTDQEEKRKEDKKEMEKAITKRK